MLSFQCRAMHDLQNISLNTLFLFYYLVGHFSSWVFYCIFFGFLCHFNANSDCTIFNLHDPILDIKRYKNGVLDSFAWKARFSQRCLNPNWFNQRAGRVVFILRIFGHTRAGTPLHIVYDRPDF